MNKKKILVAIIGIIFGCLSVYFLVKFSLQINSSSHLPSSELKFYQADLDHDGIIGEHEKNLTWAQSYDVLLKQSSDEEQLIKFADKMKIDSSLERSERINLARNEILHQAEDLLLSTGCVVPVYNGDRIFLAKEYLENTFHDLTGDIVLDNAFCNNGKKDINVVVGTELKTLDPALISEIQSGSIAGHCMRAPINNRTFNGEIVNDLSVVTCQKKDGQTVFEIFIGKFKFNRGDKNKIENYSFISDVLWDDGERIGAKDLIWSINRVASPVSGAIFTFFVENIEGYEKWKDDELKRIKKSDSEFNKTGSFYKGMSGVEDTTRKIKFADGREIIIPSVRVTIKKNKNDRIFFEGLKNIALSFSPRHRMTENTGENNETFVPDWWNYTDKNKKNGKFYFCSCGPFKAKEINNIKNGNISFERNEKYKTEKNNLLQTINFELLSSSDVAKEKFNRNELDIDDYISKGSIDNATKNKKEIRISKMPVSKYLFFNINDNSFDAIVHEEDDEKVAEEKRQGARKIFSLLLDRNNICDVIDRGYSYPSNGVVSGSIFEEPIPKNKDNMITLLSKNRKEWCQRNNRIDNEYNLFDKRDNRDINNNNNDIPEIYIKNKNDSQEEYNKKVIEVKKKNIEKVMKIADKINLKYSYNEKNGDLEFEDFPSITLTISNSENPEMLRHIENYYRKFNILVKLDKREFNYVASVMQTGKVALFCIGYSADFDDPTTFLSLFTTDSVNNMCQLGKNNRNYSNNKKSKNVIKGLKTGNNRNNLKNNNNKKEE